MRTSAGLLPGIALVLPLAAVAGLAAMGIAALSPLVAAIAIGAIVGNSATITERFRPGIDFCARRLLQIGIVVLGLRLSLGDLAGLGGDGLIVVAAVVAITFVATRWCARRLRLGSDLGLLVATGYAICGVSAIAAVDAVIDADEEETGYAISLVALCGTLSIVVLPLIAEVAGLGGVQFGTWVGSAVHDVGQVVATASSDGDPAALEAATVVKLTRVVLLAPLVAIVALQRRRLVVAAPSASSTETAAARPPVLPLFVVGFLAAVALRSTGLLGDGVLDRAADLEKIVLTIALVGLGLGIRLDRMRRLGRRPLLLGLVAWLFVAGTAFAGTALVT